MKSKGILRKLLKDKDTRFITINLSTTMLMFIIGILITLIFITTIFSGLLVLIIGSTYTHVLQILLMGLVIPLSIIFIILLAIKIFSALSCFKSKSLSKDLMEGFFSGGIKKTLQKVAMVFFIIGSIAFILFKGSEKTINTIRDIPHLIKHDYLSIDGVVEIQDNDEGYNYVKVGDTHFNEGYAFESGITNGKKYHVEYLPHSRYIVDFTLIE